MPPVRDAHNVYADAGPGMLSDAARAARPMVYVPHTKTGEVWTIDPATFAVVGRYRLGGELQHVVPSWDMTHALRERRHRQPPHAVRPEAPACPAKPIPVTDPYNLYFTPDGRSAISVAERRRELVFYDPHTWAVQQTLATPDCAGIDHSDVTPDGRTAVFTCEFAGRVAVVDLAATPRPAHDRHADPAHDDGPAGHQARARRLGVLHRRQPRRAGSGCSTGRRRRCSA